MMDRIKQLYDKKSPDFELPSFVMLTPNIEDEELLLKAQQQGMSNAYELPLPQNQIEDLIDEMLALTSIPKNLS